MPRNCVILKNVKTKVISCNFPLISNLQDIINSTYASTLASESYVTESGKLCYKFDGGTYATSNFITLPNLYRSTNMTMSIWVKALSTPIHSRIFDYSSFRLDIINSSTLRFNDVFTVIVPISLLNNWNHITLTVTGTYVILYYNGTVLSNYTLSSALAGGNTSGYLGHSISSNDPNFNGYMKNYKVVSYTMTASEVLANYNL